MRSPYCSSFCREKAYNIAKAKKECWKYNAKERRFREKITRIEETRKAAKKKHTYYIMY